VTVVSSVRKGATEAERLEKALAVLIGSTRRNLRRKNLLEVADQLEIACEILGSRRTVAKRLDVSEEMLREFASVERLSSHVKELVRQGRLTSVDTAYRFSMLPDREQDLTAEAYISGDLSGQDVRDVVSFRRRNPEMTIEEAIERVKASRDVVHYVIRFPVSENTAGRDASLRRFSEVVGNKNVVGFEVSKGIATLTVTEEGEKRLRMTAKERGISKRELVRQLGALA